MLHINGMNLVFFSQKTFRQVCFWVAQSVELVSQKQTALFSALVLEYWRLWLI